jgi:hypothetical protein
VIKPNVEKIFPIFYRGPSIDASYQVSVHLAKRFQRRRFKKIDQSETRIACGSHIMKMVIFVVRI